MTKTAMLTLHAEDIRAAVEAWVRGQGWEPCAAPTFELVRGHHDPREPEDATPDRIVGEIAVRPRVERS